MKGLNNIVAIFSNTVTEDEIQKIKEKHNDLVHDFSNEEQFKAARKVRAEMNKVLEKVDRIGIDAAQQVTDMRNNLKSLIEDAYSGTVTPFLIEDQRRKDDAKRIKKEKADKLAEQQNVLNMMKGASQRALHLPFDDIEQMVDDVMNVDLGAFDDDLKQEAQLAKDISLAQLGDALKFATEKEDMRKAKEISDAMIGDQSDEIAKLKAQLEAMQPEPPKETKSPLFFMGNESLDLSLSEWFDNNDVSEFAVKELEEILTNYFK